MVQEAVKPRRFDHNNADAIRTGTISNIYLQYLLLSGLYMLEPWERRLFNAGVIAFIGFWLYIGSGYLF